jgi:hypothetical protein
VSVATSCAASRRKESTSRPHRYLGTACANTHLGLGVTTSRLQEAGYISATCRRRWRFALATTRRTYISTQQILQGRFVQLRFCLQFLQLRVLCLELFQPPGIRDGHSCVFRLPMVERRLRDPILPAGVFGLGASLRLPQHRDDLLFCLALRFLRSHVGKPYSHSVLAAGVTSRAVY